MFYTVLHDTHPYAHTRTRTHTLYPITLFLDTGRTLHVYPSFVGLSIALSYFLRIRNVPSYY